jgi:hypothetical protein
MVRSLGVALVLAVAPSALAGCGGRTGLLVAEVEGSSTSSTTTSTSTSSQSTPAGCGEAGSTSVFVVTSSERLYRFDPPSATFSLVGKLYCPTQYGMAPFSMAVSRSGTAYLVYGMTGDHNFSGELFVASTVDASCKSTPFKRGQQGIYTFGMGFASNAPNAGETLYVASSEDGRFATIDTNTFALTLVGAVPAKTELTGSASGALYAFFQVAGSGSNIAQVDKSSGKLLTGWALPTIRFNNGWAFAQWGGDFYTFTESDNLDGTAVVHRFDPTTQAVTQVAAIGEVVVGAGVSTCAPER